MKHLRYIIVMLCALCAASASAQFRYTPVVGITSSSLKFSQHLVDVNSALGFQAGMQGEMMFPGIGFGIDLGLIYNMGGAEMNLGQKTIWASQGYGKERIMLHQINLPFHLRFKYSRMNGFEDTLMPFIYGGPEFNILVGHSNCKAMEFAGGNLDLTAGAGVELLRRWQISASYTWGMTYAMKAKLLSDYSSRPRQWTVRLAYFF